jgi:hypothetical protein
MDKIKRIHEWEGCSEASSTFKRAAAQLDSEFKRQRLYLSAAEREDDEEYGVDDACESEDDAYDSAEAMCESDDAQYESDDESGDGDGGSGDAESYSSDEDAGLEPEPADRAQGGILEPAGPQPEA